MIDSHSQRPCWIRGIAGFIILVPASGNGTTYFISSAIQASTSLFSCTKHRFPEKAHDRPNEVSAENEITLVVFIIRLQDFS
jgi:hypothetical protein